MMYIYDEEFFSKVYNVLVEHAGAYPGMKENFLYHHTMKPTGDPLIDHPVEEWRFGGRLGFGGKYWRDRNEVTCYSEDETKEAKKIIKKTNDALAKLLAEYKSPSPEDA